MIITPPPEYPFQQSRPIDIPDRYSGWLEVAKLGNKTWKAVFGGFIHWFTEFRAPEELSSDGGPPFNSEDYNKFLKRWDVRKRLSSAYYPQSNGRAEVAVKTARRILQGSINPVTGTLNTEKAARGFLAYRNTPVQYTGVSPAVALFGRRLHDHLPAKTPLRKEWVDIREAREAAHLGPSTKAGRSVKTSGSVGGWRRRSDPKPEWKQAASMVQDRYHRGCVAASAVQSPR